MTSPMLCRYAEDAVQMLNLINQLILNSQVSHCAKQHKPLDKTLLCSHGLVNVEMTRWRGRLEYISTLDFYHFAMWEASNKSPADGTISVHNSMHIFFCLCVNLFWNLSLSIYFILVKEHCPISEIASICFKMHYIRVRISCSWQFIYSNALRRLSSASSLTSKNLQHMFLLLLEKGLIPVGENCSCQELTS